MHCPHCHHTSTDVKDSRPLDSNPCIIRRRRYCPSCGARFTSTELPIEPSDLDRKYAAVADMQAIAPAEDWPAIIEALKSLQALTLKGK